MAGTPPLRKLEYVLAVARERHFRKAAERLHVDPSNLSRQVREVEDELGIEIFVRANHYVAIAEEAVEFIMDLEQMLARFVTEFEKSKRLARLRSRRKASTFVIGYSPFVVPTIPQAIRAIQSVRLRSVHLELRRASAQELTDSLIADACQACVMVRPSGQCYLEEIPLRSEPLFAVWPRAYEANLSGAEEAVGCIPRTAEGCKEVCAQTQALTRTQGRTRSESGEGESGEEGEEGGGLLAPIFG